MMIPLGIPDLLCRIRHLDETLAVELRGRAWAGGLRIDSVEVSLDGGNNWSFAKLHKPIGKWARVGWSITLEDVTPGQYTLRCRAKDERGNMSKRRRLRARLLRDGHHQGAIRRCEPYIPKAL